MYSKIIKKLRDLENGKKGLWINNLTLKKSLEVGDTINCIYDFENKVLIVEKAEILGNHTVSFRKSNPTVPILDIKNGSLTRLFEDVEKVEIQFYENKIVVKTALVEQKQKEREAKEQLRTFELFCGGGTLSEHFKYAGFTPIGGLEFNENCLKYFEHNHTSSTYTILSDIRDILPEEYPKNVDVALCGIPCTTFTKSNKQMQEVLSRHNNGESTDEDKILLESRYEAEYLTYYVLEAIRAMNPKTVVVEEVVEYSTTNAAELLRGILKHMNYEISETISIGSHTARKRWCLVANAGEKVDLDNLIPTTTKTLIEVIGKTVDEIEWKKVSEIQRLETASKKDTIGIRSSLATDTMCNTFTCHGTRHTEPSLKHPTKDLYYEFTNEDIKKIHGLRSYKLSGVKTWDRYILGNGVVDMFYQVALRIKEANKQTKFIAA